MSTISATGRMMDRIEALKQAPQEPMMVEDPAAVPANGADTTEIPLDSMIARIEGIKRQAGTAFVGPQPGPPQPVNDFGQGLNPVPDPGFWQTAGRSFQHGLYQGLPELLRQKGTEIGVFNPGEEFYKPPEGFAGTTGELVGSFVGGFADPQQLPMTVLGGKVAGPVLKKAEPLLKAVAEKAGPAVAKSLGDVIGGASGGGAIGGIRQIAATPIERWAEDPLGALTDVAKATATGTVVGGVGGAATGPVFRGAGNVAAKLDEAINTRSVRGAFIREHMPQIMDMIHNGTPEQLAKLREQTAAMDQTFPWTRKAVIDEIDAEIARRATVRPSTVSRRDVVSDQINPGPTDETPTLPAGRPPRAPRPQPSPQPEGEGGPPIRVGPVPRQALDQPQPAGLIDQKMREQAPEKRAFWYAVDRLVNPDFGPTEDLDVEIAQAFDLRPSEARDIASKARRHIKTNEGLYIPPPPANPEQEIGPADTLPGVPRLSQEEVDRIQRRVDQTYLDTPTPREPSDVGPPIPNRASQAIPPQTIRAADLAYGDESPFGDSAPGRAVPEPMPERVPAPPPVAPRPKSPTLTAPLPPIVQPQSQPQPLAPKTTGKEAPHEEETQGQGQAEGLLKPSDGLDGSTPPAPVVGGQTQPGAAALPRDKRTFLKNADRTREFLKGDRVTRPAPAGANPKHFSGTVVGAVGMNLVVARDSDGEQMRWDPKVTDWEDGSPPVAAQSEPAPQPPAPASTPAETGQNETVSFPDVTTGMPSGKMGPNHLGRIFGVDWYKGMRVQVKPDRRMFQGDDEGVYHGVVLGNAENSRVVYVRRDSDGKKLRWDLEGIEPEPSNPVAQPTLPGNTSPENTDGIRGRDPGVLREPSDGSAQEGAIAPAERPRQPDSIGGGLAPGADVGVVRQPAGVRGGDQGRAGSGEPGAGLAETQRDTPVQPSGGDEGAGGRSGRSQGHDLPVQRELGTNHRIAAGDTLAPRGDVGKFNANIDAIRLSKQLQAENRPATPDEQKRLAQYTGWGWAKEAFNPNNPTYAKQYQELSKLLTDDEFESARRSTLNAHYTSPEVIRPMWDLARRLGFRGGRVLETSAGIGHFFGLMPEDMYSKSSLVGVELDDVTANILKQLYPQADIRNEGFEKTKISNNSFDLAISNVPFGDYKIAAKDHPGHLIHDYFFLRALDKVKPGGLVMFITSNGTLDKNDPSVRRKIAERADLVGAIRLPNNAFSANAKTEVTTDIVVLRKKDDTAFAGEPFQDIAPVGRGTTSDGESRQIRANEYFAKRPSMALGDHTLKGTMYKSDSYALVAPEGADTGEALKRAIESFPENVVGKHEAAKDIESGAEHNDEAKELAYVRSGGDFYQVREGKLEPAEWLTKKGYGEEPDEPITAEKADTRRKIASDWLDLKDIAVRLFRAENQPGTTDAELAPLRQHLNHTYDAYKKKWGTLSKRRDYTEKAIFLSDDPEYALVRGLEIAEEVIDPKTGDEEFVVSKGPIFSRRIREPKKMPDRVGTIPEAIAVSMGYQNNIDPDLVSRLTGIDPEAARQQIVSQGLAFENPASGLLEPRERYLSGNVRSKLEEAEAAAAGDPKYTPNVEALRSVMPKDVGIGDIEFQAGARWIPTAAYEAFLREKMGTPSDISYLRGANTYVITGTQRTPEVLSTYATPRADGLSIYAHVLNGTYPVFRTELPDGSTIVDKASTEAARQMIDRVRDEFQTWTKTSEATIEHEGKTVPIQQALERAYNVANNSVVPANYDGSHLVLPGLTGVTPYPHQRSVVARILQERSVVMAHGVGSGKTYSQIMAAMELRRLGLAKKPVIVVQKATIGQFSASFRRAYPDAKILVATDKTFAAKNRKRFAVLASMGDYDAVILTQPQFDNLTPSPAAIQRYFHDKIAELEEVIDAERQRTGRKSPTVRELESAKRKLEVKLQNMVDRATQKRDKAVYFDEMGFDFMLIDEAHAYKNMPIVTRMTRVKGVPNGASNRAVGLEINAQHIYSKNNGRGIVMATGTPITNTMAEAYVMLKTAAPHVLKDFGIGNFDEWATSFGQTVSSLEFGWDNSWKRVQRFTKFINGPELVSMIRAGFDVKMGNKELGLKVPDLHGGKPESVIVPQNATTAEQTEWLMEIADRYNAMTGQNKKDYSWIPIYTMQAGMASALDPRLINPSAPDDPDSKVNVAVRRIRDIWKDGAAQRTTQLVFADRFKPMRVGPLHAFLGHTADDAPAANIDVNEGDLDAEAPEDEQEFGKAESDARNKQEDSDYAAGGFNLYKDIRAKLVAAGIPEAEIAIIHEFNEKQRERLFRDMNSGKVRILLGSTEKMGVGVNVQKRLVALHDLDPPRMMTPAMLEQRMGRIIRQGNENEKVYIIRYGLEQSLDTNIFQKLETKQKFVLQALTGKLTGRSFSDPADEVTMGMAEMKAMLTGDTRVLRKVELEGEITDLRSARSTFENMKAGNIRKIGDLKSRYQSIGNSQIPRIQRMSAAMAGAFGNEAALKDGLTLTIGGSTRTGREAVSKAVDGIFHRLEAEAVTRHMPVSAEATLNGLSMKVRVSPYRQPDGKIGIGSSLVELSTPGERPETVYSGMVRSGQGLLASIASDVKSAGSEIPRLEAERESISRQIQELEKLTKQTWDKEDQLKQKQEELSKIDAELEAAAAGNQDPHAPAAARRRVNIGPRPGGTGRMSRGGHVVNPLYPVFKAMDALIERHKDTPQVLWDAWRTIGGRASEVISRMGPAGKDLSEQIETVAMAKARRAGNDVVDMKQAIKGLKAADIALLGKISWGLTNPATGKTYAEERPDLVKVEARLREIFDRSMHEFAGLGGTRRAADGSRTATRGGGGWYPAAFNKAGREWLRSAIDEGLAVPTVAAWAAGEVAKGKYATPEEALAALKQWHDRQLRSQNSYFESFRRPFIPEQFIDWDLRKVGPSLLNRNALTVEAVRAWGLNLERAEAAIERIRSDADGWERKWEAALVDRWFKAHFGQGAQPRWGRAVGAWGNYETLRTLGFQVLSPLTNLGQRFTNTVMFGPDVLGRALAEFPPFVNKWLDVSRKAAEWADRAGATSDVGALSAPEAQAPGFTITQKALGLFSAVEHGNQVFAARMAAIGLAKDMDRLIRAGNMGGGLRAIFEGIASASGLYDPLAASARRVKRFGGLTSRELIDRLKKGQRLTPDELKDAAYRVVNDGQFAMDLATEPIWWRNSPVFRLAYKFKNWAWRQTEFVYRNVMGEAARGNFAPLVRFLVGALIVGELTQVLRDLLRDREESATVYTARHGFNTRETGARMLKSMGQAGAFGVLMDITYGVGDFLGGPALSTLNEGRKLITNITHAALDKGGSGIGTAIRDYAGTNIAGVRFAGEAKDLLQETVTKDPGLRQATEVERARRAASRWSQSRKRDTLAEKTVDLVKGVLYGQPDSMPGPNTISYRYAAKAIDRGDIDGAAEYLKTVLKGVPRAELTKAIASIRQSASAHSPLGKVADQDQREYFRSLPPEAAARARQLDNQWQRDYERAISKAVTASRH